MDTIELADALRSGRLTRYTSSDIAFLLMFHFTLDNIAEMRESGEIEYRGISLNAIELAASKLSDERT